jgi:hypothetical protein
MKQHAKVGCTAQQVVDATERDLTLEQAEPWLAKYEQELADYARNAFAEKVLDIRKREKQCAEAAAAVEAENTPIIWRWEAHERGYSEGDARLSEGSRCPQCGVVQMRKGDRP